MKKTLNYLVLGLIGAGILALASCANGPTPAQSEDFAKTVEEIFAVWGEANLEGNVDFYVSQ